MAATSAISLPSPVGTIRLEALGNRLSSLSFFPKQTAAVPGPYRFKKIIKDLNDYFNGKVVAFTELLLFPEQGFQNAIYKTLLTVPYGEIISYGELAKRAGYPGAARAVGTAMAQNRLPIIIPCHRVILSSGKLGAYTPGTDIKKTLLALEALTFKHSSSPL